MKERLMLYGHGNEGAFNHYTFDKTKKTQNVLRQIFKDFLNIEWPLGKEVENEKGEFEYVEINIEKNKDFHEIIGGNKFLGNPRVDVFYGDKRMFVVVHCSLDKRKEIHEIIKKKFIMPKPKNFTDGRVKISEGVKNEK